ncbi:SPOR domain-containing protein [Komagataeibacter sp. FXV2]|nr:SPOR domain-containing protein [Komagataeibacter sp. FXV2]
MSAADPTDRTPPEDRLNRQRERMSRDYDEDDDIGPRTPMEPTDADGPTGRGRRGILSSLTRVGSGLLGGNDPMTRKLLLGAAGLGGLLIVFVGGWSLFGHHQNGIPVIGPPPGPLRVKPTDPGGMQVLGADGPGAGDGGDGAHMAPGPEQPRPDDMARQYGQAETPAPAAGDGAAPAQAGPAAPGVQAQPLASAQSDAGPSPAPSPPPQGAPAPQAEATQEEASPDEDEHASAPAPAAHHAAAATHAAGGQYGVQLAALDSEAAAQKSWGRLQRQYASLFGDRQPAIVRAEHNGTVFYRLRVKGFASTAQASAFCQQVKAHGLACNPVRF